MFAFLKPRNKASHASSQGTSEFRELRAELDQYKTAFEEIRLLAERVSRGDFTARIVHWDEFGKASATLAQLNKSYDMADAFIRESGAALHAALKKEYHRKFLTQGMLGDLGLGAQAINEASAAMEESDHRRRQELEMLAGRFEEQVMAAVSAISSTATQTKDNALQLIDHARLEQDLANAVAAAAEQATVNFQTVETASQELSASIAEIAQQVSSSSEKASQASHHAAATTECISHLDKASDSIGEVVQMINDIAQQTNLLALNATIEAARAGDAGKGFSVVAGEVKTLANQTSTATTSISDQVENIQDRTKQSVQSVKDIQSLVDSLNEIASAISAATEQQSAATVEISRNIQEASAGTREVTANIHKVSETSSNTLSRAEDLLQASSHVHGQTSELKEKAEAFISMVRGL